MTMPTNAPVLSIRELSLNFKTTRGDLKALRNLSFDIPPKRIVGLVGESGCGKSTVIYAIINSFCRRKRRFSTSP